MQRTGQSLTRPLARTGRGRGSTPYLIAALRAPSVWTDLAAPRATGPLHAASRHAPSMDGDTPLPSVDTLCSERYSVSHTWRMPVGAASPRTCAGPAAEPLPRAEQRRWLDAFPVSRPDLLHNYQRRREKRDRNTASSSLPSKQINQISCQLVLDAIKSRG